MDGAVSSPASVPENGATQTKLSNDIELIYSRQSNLEKLIEGVKTTLCNLGNRVSVFDDDNNDEPTATYRVVILNKAYKKHDLPRHGKFLFDDKITTPSNTIVVVRDAHRKLLTEEITDHIPEIYLLPDLSPESLAETILAFIAKQTGIRQEAQMVKFSDQYVVFSKVIEGFHQQRSFIVITNIDHQHVKHMKSFAGGQWLKVLDFDPRTEQNGLLSVAKPHLLPGRFSITKSSTQAGPSYDKYLDWTVIHDSGEENYSATLDSHVKALVRYCAGQRVATLIVMWYTESSELDPDLLVLVSAIRSAFMGCGGIECVLITDRDRGRKNALSRIASGNKMLVVPPNVLSNWLKKEVESLAESAPQYDLLPAFKSNPTDAGTVTLDERARSTLSINMDLLTFSREPSTSSHKVGVDDGISFLQGGLISWDVINDGRFDAIRDMTGKVIKYIKEDHVEEGKTGVVTIHHQPGSGGTTVGRRVLWEMRKVVPCVALHSTVEVNEEFREKMKYLRNLTYLPVLLLVDGKTEVDKVFNSLPYERIIILRIVRYYLSMESKKNENGNFYLKGSVSREEADKMLRIYSEFGNFPCDKLASRNRGEKTYIFEYGLTAFTKDFKGIRSYVRGHLTFSKDEENHKLVIALLSLARHYGQRNLPCQMFRQILKKVPNSTIKKADVPSPGRQLIKATSSRTEWSITYTEVAREILKQVLTKDNPESLGDAGEYDLKLVGYACDELKNLATRFIKEMGNFCADMDKIPQNILEILKDVFILREDTHDDKYSMILSNVDSDSLRTDIFKELVNCFRKQADFHAHLGRHYSALEDFKKAEECLSSAVQVRRDELASVYYYRYQDSDEVLQRVHHMLGMCYSDQVKSIIESLDTALLVEHQKWPSEQEVADILKYTEMAIYQFSQTRKYFAIGSNPTFGLLGEVNIRLRVSKLVNDLKMPPNPPAFIAKLQSVYVQSFGICDQLLSQCAEQASDAQLQKSEFSVCLQWLTNTFRDTARSLQGWLSKTATISSKMYKVAIMKMNLRKKDEKFSIFTHVRRDSDIVKLLSLYEDIIKGTESSKDRISNEMLEWLKLIRVTQKPYTLHQALELIKRWDARNERDSLSAFYLYVVNVALAITYPGKNMSQSYRKEAEILRDKLESSERRLSRHLLYRSREWLGNAVGATANILVHRDQLDPSFLEYPHKTNLLRRCTGTITTVKGYYGWIELEGYYDPPIRIFFAPTKHGLTRQHAMERVRVEFYVQFNPRHGAEAFDVAEIQRCPCGREYKIRNAEQGQNRPERRCQACGRAF